MEKPAFLDTLIDKISILKDKIIDWIKTNKKISIIVGSLLIIILICIIILISSFKEKKEEKVIEDKLQLTHELVIPSGPELPKDYTISRETKEKWSINEGEEWFSIPSDKEMNNLSKANNNIIKEILGAAP